MKYYYSFLMLLFCSVVFAQTVSIPDTNFKNALLNHIPKIDINEDGEIQLTEAQNVTALTVAGKYISSLEGIEAFTNITSLNCGYNQLTNLTLDQNTALKTLNCQNNNLQSLNLNNNQVLTDFNCRNNQFTALNVSSNTALSNLNCENNQISSLNLSTNVALKTLNCQNNNLSSLVLNNNTVLKDLDCDNNQITNLDVSQNSNLFKLSCEKNQLNNLNIGEKLALVYFYCGNNQLTSLDVSQCPAIANFSCNNNQLTSINVSNNTALYYFNCNDNQLSYLNVSNIPGLTGLYCNNNQLSELVFGNDLNSHHSLQFLQCENNKLENLSLTYITTLIGLKCSENRITYLDLSYGGMLEYLYCFKNHLTDLNLSQDRKLDILDCSDNELVNLNIKNGSNLSSLSFSNNSNLNFICADESEFAQVQGKINEYGYANTCLVNDYCSFVPGGVVYLMKGKAVMDNNNDGCDSNDLDVPFIKFSFESSLNSGSFFSQENGEYNLYVNAGNYVVTPELENPNYFNISPPSVTVNFPGTLHPHQQDFCMTANGNHNDLEVSILPLTQARPGFKSYYKIVYKNKGTTALAGNVTFSYSSNHMVFNAANPMPDSQAAGVLQWDFVDLKPFETKSAICDFTINPPTHTTLPVNADDVLPFSATINPLSGDETPNDNDFILEQVVVNSYDPNDKTCLQGKTIEESQVGDYLHYLIRFENTGSANAVNIVVKDNIDATMYDISSLIPLDASHGYTTRIKNNVVEFIFENINLPFDDANNDGYVAFKIKSKSGLVIGDVLENKAEIYFDFNFPIITEKESTEVVNLLSVSDYEIDRSIGVHPNPVNDVLNVSASSAVKQVAVCDVQGRQLQQISYTNHEVSRVLNLAHLAKGVYFIKVTSAKGELVSKINKR